MVSHADRHRARHRFPKRPRALRQAEGEKPPDSAGFETGAFESLESDFQEVRPHATPAASTPAARMLADACCSPHSP